MVSLIIDYSYAHPNAATIRADGYVGVMRYLSRDSSKVISAAERDSLQAEGLGIGLVFEDDAQRALGGAAAGALDGKFANAAADALGFPRSLPIFYAVDFAVSAAQLPTVLAYLQAAGAQGRTAHGYGSVSLINYLAAHGLPDGWQTCAWSAGVVSAKAAIYQRLTHSTTLPGSYDEDQVLDPLNDGLWYLGAPLPPIPSTNPPITLLPGTDMLAVIYNVTGGPLAVTNGFQKRLLLSNAQATEYAELGLVNPAQYDPKTFVVTAKWVDTPTWNGLTSI